MLYAAFLKKLRIRKLAIEGSVLSVVSGKGFAGSVGSAADRIVAAVNTARIQKTMLAT